MPARWSPWSTPIRTGTTLGGAHGVVGIADVASGRVPVIAPVGFLEHAVAENVYAGNAMNRRMFYQYGALLDRSPFGHVDHDRQGSGSGVIGLIPPTIEIVADIEEHTVDGDGWCSRTPRAPRHRRR